MYSPDGSKIVYAQIQADGVPAIYTMNADGSNQTPLVVMAGVANTEPRYSPDGTKIVFQSDRDNPGNAKNQIYIMDANGSNQTR